MSDDARDAYLRRFRNVLDHVDRHLDDELDVDGLSRVAAFSKFHFHRQFSELFEVAIWKYVQLLRLKRAAAALAFREKRVIDVALDSGFESPEAFARAFKKVVGASPSEFREAPEWTELDRAMEPLARVRREHMKPAHAIADVRTVRLPETRLAAIEHRGDPARLGETIRRFIAWRRTQPHLSPKASATFNLVYDDPEATPAVAFRFDIGAATTKPVPANTAGIVEKTIPAGRYATLRHTGGDETLPHTVRFLYATWLPRSREELADFPMLFQRIAFSPDVPEHEAMTDVLLPLA